MKLHNINIPIPDYTTIFLGLKAQIKQYEGWVEREQLINPSCNKGIRRLISPENTVNRVNLNLSSVALPNFFRRYRCRSDLRIATIKMDIALKKGVILVGTT